MPVEIREIIIRTEISVNEDNRASLLKEKELVTLKNQLLEELKRIAREQRNKKAYKR